MSCNGSWSLKLDSHTHIPKFFTIKPFKIQDDYFLLNSHTCYRCACKIILAIQSIYEFHLFFQIYNFILSKIPEKAHMCNWCQMYPVYVFMLLETGNSQLLKRHSTTLKSSTVHKFPRLMNCVPCRFCWHLFCSQVRNTCTYVPGAITGIRDREKDESGSHPWDAEHLRGMQRRKSLLQYS